MSLFALLSLSIRRPITWKEAPVRNLFCFSPPRAHLFHSLTPLKNDDENPPMDISGCTTTTTGVGHHLLGTEGYYDANGPGAVVVGVGVQSLDARGSRIGRRVMARGRSLRCHRHCHCHRHTTTWWCVDGRTGFPHWRWRIGCHRGAAAAHALPAHGTTQVAGPGAIVVFVVRLLARGGPSSSFAASFASSSSIIIAHR